MAIINFLKLIRFPNLVFIALAQWLIHFSLYIPYKAESVLNTTDFILLVFATLCIAASGYIINDIFDYEIDRINKPKKVILRKHISEKHAHLAFILFNIMGVGIGFYLSTMLNRPPLVAAFIFTSVLLYLYASSLKKIVVVSNVLVSALVAMSLLLVPLFDLLPAVTPANQYQHGETFKLIGLYALFAFLINLLREIVKDLMDINGDYKGGISSLPVVLGSNRTLKIVSLLNILYIGGIIYYMYTYLYNRKEIMLYFLILILGPLLYFLVKSVDAKKLKHFRHLSLVLKIVMFTGIFSMLFYRYGF